MLAGVAIVLVPMATAQDPDCTTGTSAGRLDLLLEAAEGAYSRADLPAYRQAMDEVAPALSCLDEPTTRSLCARLHRVMGLHHFLERELDAELASFAAARHVQPGYRLPTDLIPEGNPVRDHYLAVSIDDPTFVDLPRPASGYLTLDGREGLLRPTSWPTVAQHLGDDGGVLDTWYLAPGAPAPDYPVEQPPPEVELLPDAPAARSPARLRTPLLVTAGGCALASAVALGVALASSDRYHDPQTTDVDELERLRSRTNLSTRMSVVLGGAAVGTGAAAVVVGRF